MNSPPLYFFLIFPIILFITTEASDSPPDSCKTPPGISEETAAAIQKALNATQMPHDAQCTPKMDEIDCTAGFDTNIPYVGEIKLGASINITIVEKDSILIVALGLDLYIPNFSVDVHPKVTQNVSIKNPGPVCEKYSILCFTLSGCVELYNITFIPHYLLIGVKLEAGLDINIPFVPPQHIPYTHDFGQVKIPLGNGNEPSNFVAARKKREKIGQE